MTENEKLIWACAFATAKATHKYCTTSEAIAKAASVVDAFRSIAETSQDSKVQEMASMTRQHRHHTTRTQLHG